MNAKNSSGKSASPAVQQGQKAPNDVESLKKENEKLLKAIAKKDEEIVELRKNQKKEQKNVTLTVKITKSLNSQIKDEASKYLNGKVSRLIYDILNTYKLDKLMAYHAKIQNDEKLKNELLR